MTTSDNSVSMLGWIARIGGILFALFISIFALDVFSEHLSFWKTLPALFIHLIPSFFVLSVIMIAWRKPLVGAIIFMLLAIAYLFFAQGRFHWSVYAIISGPLAIISVFFGCDWWKARSIK